MNSRSLRHLSLAVVVFAAATVTAARADDKSQGDHSMQQMEKKGEATMGLPMPKPGPEHAMLAKAVGHWKATTKMRMDPSQPPVMGEGEEDITSICNGLWISVTYMSKQGDFEGHGLEGYDTMKKRFTGTWVDSWGTYLSTYEGTSDAAGKVFTYTMSSPNPVTGVMEAYTMQHEYKDANTRVARTWRGTDTKAEPMMEISYTRM